jgi:hypothetical protein
MTGSQAAEAAFETASGNCFCSMPLEGRINCPVSDCWYLSFLFGQTSAQKLFYNSTIMQMFT